MKHRTIKYSLILLLFMLGGSFGVLFIPSQLIQSINTINDPKISAGEITITTPEDKTYTQPDSGYYPATYGFEDELGNTYGSAMRFIDEYQGYSPGTYCYIRSAKGNGSGHMDTMGISDAQAGSYTWGVHNFDDPQSEGTIEFYLYSADGGLFSALERQYLQFRSSDDTIAFRITIQLHDDKITYYNGYNWQEIASIIDKEWYHHFISFNCESGIKGQFTWIITDSLGNEVGRVENIEFENDLSTIDEMYFGTVLSDYGYGYTHWDAFGFSWDPNYNTGDNLNEGLLLAYDTTTTLQWQGYSLDGQENVTIYGNYTIPLPSNGVHHVQMFGNDTLGTNYASNLRWFTVDTNPLSEDDWLYFRELSFNPSTPENNFQVKILLNDSNFEYANANSDGSDLRFYDPNNQKLSYWIESWVYGGESIVWVNIPVSGTSSIYMYYGNSQALSESNGEDVFIFFDDFEGSNLNLTKWNTDDDQYSTITVTNGEVRLYTKPPSVFYERANYGFHDYYIEHGETYGYHAITGGAIFTPSENNWLIGQMHWINSTSAPYYENDMLYSDDTDNPTGPLPVRFFAHTAYYGPGTHWGCVISSNDETIGIPGRSMRVRTWLDKTGEVDIRIDWVAVHKWSVQLPTVTIGEEFPNQISPILTIFAPTQNEIFGVAAPNFEILLFGAELNTTWYTLDGGMNNYTFTGLTGTINQAAWDAFGNETIHITFFANNSFGNETAKEILVRKDIIDPIISINSPLDSQLIGSSSPYFELIIVEPNIDSMWYSLDNGDTNITFGSFSGTIDQVEWDKVENGTAIIRFTVKDEGGNEGYSEVTIRKDIQGPSIIINSPSNLELFGDSPPDYDVSISDQNLDSTWYTLDGTTKVFFTGSTGAIDQVEWDKLPDGLSIIGFFANDTVGNLAQTVVVVDKDTLAPIITINSPMVGEIFGVNAPTYDISIAEGNLGEVWYSLDYGSTNFPIYSFSGTIDQAEWESKGGGTIPIRFYANDTLGHESFIDVLVVKDLIFPVITINLPYSGEVFGSTSPNYDITITESHLDSYWYSLDGGTTNFTIGSQTGTISQTEWNKKSNGTVIIRFYARDEGGNEAFKDVMVRKDVNVPLITIISPIMFDVTGYRSPVFELSVIEPNLDSMWYTLDNGITTYPIIGLSGTIDSAEWKKFSEGMIVIEFYAEDSAGNQAFAEVQVEKDLTAPVITINQPEIGDVFIHYPPIYSLSIDELHSFTFWYSLDNGAHNYTITETTGAISEASWDTIPNGHVTLRFYAEDEAGNTGQTSIIITKDSPETPVTPPPGIPGYDVFILLGLISVISTIILLRRLKTK